mmetsp:Transcript_27782/g.69644  ORF Transcript_27782/g.69644 Transcript_27782/m.69644 type:complete len:345 (-) Transcript_27782:489-1523(-)
MPISWTSAPWTGGARLLDGRLHAARWRGEVAAHIVRMSGRLIQPPGLAAVVVGERPDSLLYVRRKREACEEAGMRFFHEHLPWDVQQGQVLDVLRRLNADEKVHGILLQLPVPPHLSESRLLECIDPRKDVDGLSPENIARLSTRGIWRPAFMPCAPLGCMELLWRENIPVRGCSVAILGDSNIVGMPMSWLLRDAGAASVTLVHSRAVELLKKIRTEEPSSHNAATRERILMPVRGADVVIAAVGCAELVRGDWVKPGATVVDIGINAVPLSAAETQETLGTESAYSLPGTGLFRLVGDVAAEEVSHVAGAMTSVPGGAGPMTIAALLSNTYLSATRRYPQSS